MAEYFADNPAMLFVVMVVVTTAIVALGYLSYVRKGGYRLSELRGAFVDPDAIEYPHIEALLEPNEELRGILTASRAKMFRQPESFTVAVTADRLVLQPLDLRGRPVGEVRTIEARKVASARLRAAGTGYGVAASIAKGMALTLKLKLRDGRKLELTMNKGGPAILGGQRQLEGVAALRRWVEGEWGFKP